MTTKRIKSFMQPRKKTKQKTPTRKQVTSQCGPVECSSIMCFMSLFTPPPADVHPSSSYSRYITSNGHQVLLFLYLSSGHTLETENPFLNP